MCVTCSRGGVSESERAGERGREERVSAVLWQGVELPQSTPTAEARNRDVELALETRVSAG